MEDVVWSRGTWLQGFSYSQHIHTDEGFPQYVWALPRYEDKR
jgi:hypothetical protein